MSDQLKELRDMALGNLDNVVNLTRVAEAAVKYMSIPHMPMDNEMYDLLDALKAAGYEIKIEKPGCDGCGWKYTKLPKNFNCPPMVINGPCDKGVNSDT